jgi:hypothetical protein
VIGLVHKFPDKRLVREQVPSAKSSLLSVEFSSTVYGRSLKSSVYCGNEEEIPHRIYETTTATESRSTPTIGIRLTGRGRRLRAGNAVAAGVFLDKEDCGYLG